MISENVLKRAVGSARSYTNAVVLTHNIDFMFTQSILVPKLRRHGAPRLTIFADAACAAGSYKNSHGQLMGTLGQTYRVVPVDLGQFRRFHPKAIMVAGPERVRLAVGSGNLGHGGWSANREIWTYFEFPEGDGGPAVAAFQSYLKTVLQLAPTNSNVEHAILDIFNTAKWAPDLPEPGQLLGLPADRTLLERMLEIVGGRATSVDVVSPYFDEGAVAAARLADGFGCPVRLMVQAGKEGLSKSTAVGLPSSVELVGITAHTGDRIPTVHAKFYAARDKAGVTIFAGSANCSQAALLSTTNGNAELMAVSRIDVDEYERLLDGVELTGLVPDLPTLPPNEDWQEVIETSLRILSARYEGGVLHVSYKLGVGSMSGQITIIAGKNRYPAGVAQAGVGDIRIEIPDPGQSVMIERDVDGFLAVSAPMWVDHEALLSRTRPEQQFRARAASRSGEINLGELFELMSDYKGHLGTFIPWSREGEKKATAPGAYKLEDTFSPTFGKGSSVTGRSQDFGEPDHFGLLAALFRTRSESTHQKANDYRQPPEDEEELDVDQLADKKARKPAPPEPALAEKLARELEAIAKRLTSDKFLESRPPERSTSDIQTFVALLAIARRRNWLTLETIDTISKRVFGALFGTGTGLGLFTRYLAAHEDFAANFQSPKLTAAITLWLSDLVLSDPDADLTFNTALAAANWPWLTLQGDAAVLEWLAFLAECLDEPELEVRLTEIWVSWAKSGAAVALLRQELASAEELWTLVGNPTVAAGEILWQKDFFLAGRAYQFDSRLNVDVYPLHGGEKKAFRSNYTVPLKAIIDKCILPDEAAQICKGLLGGVVPALP
jgi:hypothetical protein